MASPESYTGEENKITRPPAIPKAETDVFEEQPDHDFHYKTLSWQVGLALDCENFSSQATTLVC
jgi:hypothetical protein